MAGGGGDAVGRAPARRDPAPGTSIPNEGTSTNVSTPRTELRKLAKARLADAEALFAARRYDGAVYLCGYAVELALKARICRTLRWQDFPASRREFEGLTSFKTHDLDVLLNLSGVATRIRREYTHPWSVVSNWNPELRYRPIGSASRTHAESMIRETHVVLRAIR